MSSLEDEIRDALRSEAGRLREVRPLSLESAPRPVLAPRRRQARPPWTWLAPATAAALVIVLAIALAIVRMEQSAPVSPVVPAPPVPTGFPRYYLGLAQLRNDGTGTRVVVGDVATGKTLAAYNAPAGEAFVTASGAGGTDDRTFVVAEATAQGNPPPHASPYYPYPRAWYLLRVLPGSTPRVTMTRLAIQPSNPELPITDVTLSADGRYLAVAAGEGLTLRADIRVYSVSTGQLLRTWSMVSAGTLIARYPGNLSWVNGDRTVAFDIYLGSREQVRTVSVTAPGAALLTVSHVVWSQYVPAVISSFPKSGTAPWCGLPTLTPDGRTVLCSAPYLYAGKPPSAAATEWLAYSLSAPARPRVLALIPPPGPKLPKGMRPYEWGTARVSASGVIGFYGFYEPRGAASGPVTISEYIARGTTVRQLGTGVIPVMEMRVIW